MAIQTTITDPEVLAQPFVMETNYLRRRDWQIKEYVCQENNRDGRRRSRPPVARHQQEIASPEGRPEEP